MWKYILVGAAGVFVLGVGLGVLNALFYLRFFPTTPMGLRVATAALLGGLSGGGWAYFVSTRYFDRYGW